MTLLDTYAVLALLKGEPAAPEVQRLLDGEPKPLLTALGAAEVFDHLVRIEGATDEEAALDLAQLGLSEPVVVDESMGRRAGLLRAAHYHRTARAVSLADCVAAEAARWLAASLASSDRHLLELCHEEGIAVTVLPDSAGQRWPP